MLRANYHTHSTFCDGESTAEEMVGRALVLMAHGAGGGSVVPRGDTVIEPGSTLVLIVPSGDRRIVSAFAGDGR